jgi:hypothetical protein
MNKLLKVSTVVFMLLSVAGCAETSDVGNNRENPDRAILSPYRSPVTNENLLDQPRVSAYMAEVKSVLPERFFTPPQNLGKNTDSIAIYYHPVFASLSGKDSLAGSDQYLGLLSDSGWDYPIDKLSAGMKLIVFLVADPAPRSDGLSESAPSWVGYLDNKNVLRGLSPHDSVSIDFEKIRSSLGL